MNFHSQLEKNFSNEHVKADVASFSTLSKNPSIWVTSLLLLFSNLLIMFKNSKDGKQLSLRGEHVKPGACGMLYPAGFSFYLLCFFSKVPINMIMCQGRVDLVCLAETTPRLSLTSVGAHSLTVPRHVIYQSWTHADGSNTHTRKYTCESRR